MHTKIKTQLEKTLILPILDYPLIPIHALRATQISKLQIVQNKALRFATNQRYPYTLNITEIHELTHPLPINIRLHLQAEKTWARIQLLDQELYNDLTEYLANITTYNTHFPSRLVKMDAVPAPRCH